MWETEYLREMFFVCKLFPLNISLENDPFYFSPQNIDPGVEMNELEMLFFHLTSASELKIFTFAFALAKANTIFCK